MRSFHYMPHILFNKSSILKKNKDTKITFICVTNRLIVVYLSLRKDFKKTSVTLNDL